MEERQCKHTSDTSMQQHPSASVTTALSGAISLTHSSSPPVRASCTPVSLSAQTRDDISLHVQQHDQRRTAEVGGGGGGRTCCRKPRRLAYRRQKKSDPRNREAGDRHPSAGRLNPFTASRPGKLISGRKKCLRSCLLTEYFSGPMNKHISCVFTKNPFKG